MNSSEIKDYTIIRLESVSVAQVTMLKEIAYQLALLNEHRLPNDYGFQTNVHQDNV